MNDDEKKAQEAQYEVIQNSQKYAKNYDESKLNKLLKVVAKVAKFILEPALTLYMILKNASVPVHVKGIMMGALGYLILPMDLVPDLIPMAGYVDDSATLLAVLKMFADYNTTEIKQKVKEAMANLGQ